MVMTSPGLDERYPCIPCWNLTMSEVRLDVTTVDRTQWCAVSDALAAAFEDDPVFSWLLPDDATRRRALRRYFAVETRRIVLKHGLSVAGRDRAQVVGSALVLPPGRWRTPVGVQAAFGPRYIQIFGRHLPRALGVLTEMERRHRSEPHVYFPYIGVAPGAQGNGLGTAMMTPVLERCDRDLMPAYLEASNPACARLYERLGFVGTEEIRPLGSPPIRLMWRRPTAR
jgi:GNAT superfamily N-acetyltransferase